MNVYVQIKRKINNSNFCRPFKTYRSTRYFLTILIEFSLSDVYKVETLIIKSGPFPGVMKFNDFNRIKLSLKTNDDIVSWVWLKRI